MNKIFIKGYRFIQFFQIYNYNLDLDSSFENVGLGWCRPDGCDGKKDKRCRIDGFFKDEVDFYDCGKACISEPSCTGFAHSNDKNDVAPNRCFVHGNTSSTALFSEWNKFKSNQNEFSPVKSSESPDSMCWKRKGTTL